MERMEKEAKDGKKLELLAAANKKNQDYSNDQDGLLQATKRSERFRLL